MELWRRTKQTGWLVNGEPMTLREVARNYGLYPVDRPVPLRGRVRRWWHGKRVQWARRIGP